MKNLSFKVSLIILSYVILIVLIILSYISIVPEENLLVLENKTPLVKKIENKFGAKDDSIYKILEKPKSIEHLIEDQLIEEKKQINTKKNINTYILQLASFRDKNKSKKTSEKISKIDFFKNEKIDLKIKEIILKNNIIYYRVVTVNSFSFKKANSHCEILKKKKINCIVIKE